MREQFSSQSTSESSRKREIKGRNKLEKMAMAEQSALEKAVRGPVGRWLMGAMLLFSSEGCAGFSQAVRGYRQQVETEYFVGNMNVPGIGALTVPLGDPSQTREAQERAERVSPPVPENAISTPLGTGANTMVGGRLTLREHTPSSRLRQAARGNPELLLSGDRLFIRDIHGDEVLDVEHMETRWSREMRPGTIYRGTDGNEYIMVAFRRFAIPSAYDPRPAQAPAPSVELPPQPTRRPELTRNPFTVGPMTPLSEAQLEDLGRRMLHRELTLEDIGDASDERGVAARRALALERSRERHRAYEPPPRTALPTDPGTQGLQTRVNQEYGSDFGLHVARRLEMQPPPRRIEREGFWNDVLGPWLDRMGRAPVGYQEWESPVVFYLLQRTHDPSEETVYPRQATQGEVTNFTRYVSQHPQ